MPLHFVHTVYFALEDHAADSRASFIKLCQHYLPGHPGEIYFSVGERNDEIIRDVSDLNYDIAMTIVFDSFAAYESYQASARHDGFRDELSRIPVTVRVFDSLLNS